MFSVRASGIAAGIAFTASVIIGFVFHKAGVLVVFLRALLCGLLFFVLAAGIHIFIARFLPELLKLGSGDEYDEDEDAEPGSRVDITVEDEDSGGDISEPQSPDDKFREAVASALNPQDTPQENPDTAAEGMDQNGKKEYTEKNGESVIASDTPQDAVTADPAQEASASKPADPAQAVSADADGLDEDGPSPVHRKRPEPRDRGTPALPEDDGNNPAPKKARDSGANQPTQKKNDMDPSKMDPKQMATTIQTMLRQEE